MKPRSYNEQITELVNSLQKLDDPKKLTFSEKIGMSIVLTTYIWFISKV